MPNLAEQVELLLLKCFEKLYKPLLVKEQDLKQVRIEQVSEQINQFTYKDATELLDGVTTPELLRIFDDLIAFAHLLRKCDAGLTLPVKTRYRVNYLSHQVDKQEIADAFVEYIRGGMSLICLEGTTVAKCAERLLQSKKYAAILTNNMGIAELAMEDLDIRLTGGDYLATSHACVGNTVADAFTETPCRGVVLGVSGLSQGGGLSVFHPHECKLRLAAMSAATEEIIVVADRSKLGHVDRYEFGSLHELLKEKSVTVITNAFDPRGKQETRYDYLSWFFSIFGASASIRLSILGEDQTKPRRLNMILGKDGLADDRVAEQLAEEVVRLEDEPTIKTKIEKKERSPIDTSAWKSR